MKNFKNKIVVITGAGSGIGKATTLEFARLGAKVAINDYREENLQGVISELKSLGTVYYASAFDVSNKEAMFNFAENVKLNLGSADIIMNNAGIPGTGGNFMKESIEFFEKVMSINFWAVVYGTRAFVPQLLENNKEAAIINISSLFGLIGIFGNSSYCSSKFAFRGFNEAIAMELQRTNITVHSVHPGGIKTNIGLFDNEGKKMDMEMDIGEKFHSAYLKTTPETMAKAIIKGVEKRKFRIIAGERALETYLGVLLFPYNFMKKLIIKDHYNRGLKEIVEKELFL